MTTKTTTRPTDDQIRELCILTTRDEAGRHFTEWSDHYEALEGAGLITVHRPVHDSTGIPYSPEYWSLEITDAGQDLVDANEELHPAEGITLTMAQFRESRPEYDDEFQWLARHDYTFDDDDQVEIVEEGRERGGHLRLHGPGYAIQFSQGEPIVSTR